MTNEELILMLERLKLLAQQIAAEISELKRKASEL